MSLILVQNLKGDVFYKAISLEDAYHNCPPNHAVTMSSREGRAIQFSSSNQQLDPYKIMDAHGYPTAGYGMPFDLKVICGTLLTFKCSGTSD